MEKLKELKDKLLAFWAKTKPAREKTGRVLKKIGFVLGEIGKWIYRLRGPLLAIPVVVAAIRLAQKNMARLPETVGIFLLEDGNYRWMVERNAAVMYPLVLTAICLVLMFCSRRTVYPWLIAIFTLVLPIVIYITNVFPA